MLVAHRSAGRGVPEAGHELGERGASLGGEDGAGVAEVVEGEVLSARRLPGRVVDAVEARWCELAAVACREEQAVASGLGVLQEVLAD